MCAGVYAEDQVEDYFNDSSSESSEIEEYDFEANSMEGIGEPDEETLQLRRVPRIFYMKTNLPCLFG